jgi:GNAT superfamily N-acetyltransferase
MALPTEAADTATMTAVRPAVPEDAYDVARVHVRSWQSAYRGLIAQPYLDSLEPETWAGRYTFGRVGIGLPSTLIAVDGSTICGLATTGLCRDADLSNFGELMAIYVDPAYLRTGVGRLLIEAARERLRAIGVSQAALWALDGNIGARRFYERDGWRFDGTRRTRTYGNAPVEEVRYQRTPI